MIREAQAQGGSWDLEQFITPEESAWFSYLSDAGTSARKDRVLPARAPPTPWPQPLLTASSTRYRPGGGRAGGHVAKLRFAHAETLIAGGLMKLAGSRQAPSPAC